MKQFVITIPNPVRGKGARGFDRKPKRGEPTFSIFHCYAQSEKRARELTAGYFSMRKVPDGTKFVEIVSDPRVKQESFVDMRLMSAPIALPVVGEAPALKKFELVVVQRAVQQDTADEYAGNRPAYLIPPISAARRLASPDVIASPGLNKADAWTATRGWPPVLTGRDMN